MYILNSYSDALVSLRALMPYSMRYITSSFFPPRVTQLQLHERGMKLQQTIYNQVKVYQYVQVWCACCPRTDRSFASQACKLLSDDYEQVRSAAVQMVWVLSQLYPERWTDLFFYHRLARLHRFLFERT